MHEYEDMEHTLRVTLERHGAAVNVGVVAAAMKRHFDVSDRDVVLALRGMDAVVTLRRPSA